MEAIGIIWVRTCFLEHTQQLGVIPDQGKEHHSIGRLRLVFDQRPQSANVPLPDGEVVFTLDISTDATHSAPSICNLHDHSP